jgi:hypothetical protein
MPEQRSEYNGCERSRHNLTAKPRPPAASACYTRPERIQQFGGKATTLQTARISKQGRNSSVAALRVNVPGSKTLRCATACRCWRPRIKSVRSKTSPGSSNHQLAALPTTHQHGARNVRVTGPTSTAAGARVYSMRCCNTEQSPRLASSAHQDTRKRDASGCPPDSVEGSEM